MDKSFKLLLEMALEEDLGLNGDITSEAIFTTQEGSFALYSKDSGIFCGKEIIEAVFHAVDPNVVVTLFKEDGDSLNPGDFIAEFQGSVVSILKAERTAINFIGFLSGIATATAKLVDQSGGITILDTRKTLPGFRTLSKYAVRCGGGSNHRMGLFDMVMIKENHADAAGSITNAVNAVRSKWGDRFQIEVETRSLPEVIEAVELGVNRIMLDNMSNETMKEACDLIAGRCEVEASGNMNIERLPGVAEVGVDFVSFGNITHSVKTFDFSLRQRVNENE